MSLDRYWGDNNWTAHCQELYKVALFCCAHCLKDAHASQENIENTMDEAYLDGKVTELKESLDCHVPQPCQSDHNDQCTFINFTLKSDNKHFMSKKIEIQPLTLLTVLIN